MRLPAFLSLLALLLPEAETASLPKGRRWGKRSPGEDETSTAPPPGSQTLGLDHVGKLANLSLSELLTDPGDRLPKVNVTSLAPPSGVSPAQSTVAPTTPSPKPMTTRPTTLGPLDSTTSQGLPTCLVCVCLGSSVYCDDIDLESIPPLPRMTAYLYARFNRIRHVRAGDFKGLTKLKKIDLSGNFISSIDNNALRLLPALRDLVLLENQLAALPMLPRGIEFLDVRHNRLRSPGIQPGAFEALEKLQFLYLADNLLDSIPGPFPLSLRSLHLQNNKIKALRTDSFCDPVEHRYTRRQLEDIRLDGNPINLSHFPSAYFCLPRLPTGRLT
ncbi:opticin [Tupaia chinensis]|uniref:Opticin n=1 Tax=Tupaia chinensis TaxID=246437 RepID=L9JBP3_TUPCH|nr:opticin [Tupaia chinensis]ELW47709.1 Opticin [Tupaia chinensis]